MKDVGSEIHFIGNQSGTSPGAVGAFEKSEQSLGAYLQNTYWPAPFLGLNLGARLDADSRFGHALSPRAAATVVPWSGAAMKLIYSTAFRAPTAWDVYYGDPSYWIPGGRGIEPEGVRSVEASAEQRLGSQRLFLGVFRSWWEDLVLLQDLSDDEVAAAVQTGQLLPDTQAGVQLQNVSRIDSQGLSAGLYGALGGGALRYGASVTRAHTRIRAPGGASERVPVAAPTVGNARISWTLPDAWPTLALAARYVSRRPTTDHVSDAPSFVAPQVELRAAVSGALPIEGLSYRLTANYSFLDVGPYAVGPTPADGGPRPLLPIDPLRFGVGLQYDLLP